MSEEVIAEKYVKPYLIKELGFDEKLISGYGNVSVQAGPFKLGYADFVCYVMSRDDKKPYLVVEVKKPGERLYDSQPWLYANALRAPFFALTNGEKWVWYVRGDSLDECHRIEKVPSPHVAEKGIPSEKRLRFDVKDIIDSFEEHLKQENKKCRDSNLISHQKEGCTKCPQFEGCLLGDTIWHDTCPDRIRSTIQSAGPNSMSVEELKELFDSLLDWLMFSRKVNIGSVKSSIMSNPERFKAVLSTLYDEKTSIETRFDKARTIKGFGPFLTSQLLSSVDKKKYVVVEDNLLEALFELRIIPAMPRNITGKDYAYINRVCCDLMQNKFENSFGFGLALVHNLLWTWNKYKYVITGQTEEST